MSGPFSEPSTHLAFQKPVDNIDPSDEADSKKGNNSKDQKNRKKHQRPLGLSDKKPFNDY